MAFIRNGYVWRRTSGTDKDPISRDWFLVKHNGATNGVISCSASICAPGSLVGRKVRLRLEILPDGNDLGLCKACNGYLDGQGVCVNCKAINL